MKNTVLIYLLILVVTVGCNSVTRDKMPQETDRFDRLFSGDIDLIDLTHTLSTSSPWWPGTEESPYQYDTIAAHDDGTSSLGGYTTFEHFGTHLDAPVHFAEGQISVDKIPVERFFCPAVIVDVREKCTQDPDYLLSVSDLESWEATHGEIPKGAIVLMNTGWASKWDDMVAYRNMDEDGNMHFPGFSPEAGKFLIEKRNIHGIGIDNLSVDAGDARGFPTHEIVNGAGKYHLENVGNLDKLPASGAYLIVAPIKLEGGSGGQVRIFALIP